MSLPTLNLTRLFCEVDDFCKVFIPTWEKTQLNEGCKKRRRTRNLSPSEIITLIVFYHSSGYRTFKDDAERGKSSTGWFYGFKRYLLVDDCGQILFFRITRGNVDDRKPVPRLLKHFIGKVFGDRGYISKKLAELLALDDVELITSLKKNMKPRVLAAFDKLLLPKRCIIETINDQLKNIFNLEHSRHRLLSNYMINVVAGLVAYSYQDKLPSLNIARKDLISLF
jgi:transposase